MTVITMERMSRRIIQTSELEKDMLIDLVNGVLITILSIEINSTRILISYKYLSSNITSHMSLQPGDGFCYGKIVNRKRTIKLSELV